MGWLPCLPLCDAANVVVVSVAAKKKNVYVLNFIETISVETFLPHSFTILYFLRVLLIKNLCLKILAIFDFEF